jgi:hypothetical protein
MWIVFFNIVLNHRLKKLVEEPKEGNAWHADHIIPVYKGGGMHAHFLCFFGLISASPNSSGFRQENVRLRM